MKNSTDYFHQDLEAHSVQMPGTPRSDSEMGESPRREIEASGDSIIISEAIHAHAAAIHALAAALITSSQSPDSISDSHDLTIRALDMAGRPIK